MTGWRKFRLDGLTTKIGSGATPRGGKKAYKPEGTSLIRSLNVHDGEFRAKNLAFIDENQAAKLSNVVVQEGDVLLNITGASIARCCLAPEQFLPARVNQHVSIIRPRRELVDSRFLSSLLVAKEYKDRLLHEGEKAGATRQALTKAHLQSFNINIPPLPEQHRIVAILDEALAAIATATANAEKNIANARELFESELNRVFSQKEEGWMEKGLNEVCTITSKLVDPRRPEYLDLHHIGAGNIVSRSGELVGVQTAREEGLISGKFVFDSRMVLYSKIRPYLMKVTRPEFQGLCSADIYPLMPTDSMMTRDFLYYLLLSPQFTDYAIKGSPRAGMPKVNRSHLFSYFALVPLLDHQHAIATALNVLKDESELLASIYQEKIGHITALKQSLLDKAFTGELTTDPDAVDRTLSEAGI